MPTVSMPDGTLVDIPDDVSEDQLNQLRQIAQPQQAPPAASPEIPIPEIKPSGYVGRGEFAPEAGAESAPIVTQQAQDPLAQVARGVFGAIGSMVPKSLSDVMQMITLPRPSEFESKDLPVSEQLGEAWRGEHGLEEQAKAITGTALQAAPLIHLPFAESPLRPTPKDLSLVNAFRNLTRELESPVPLSDAAENVATKEIENASKITGAEGIPSTEIRPSVDEETSLRQQGETAGILPIKEGESVAPPSGIEGRAPTVPADVGQVPNGIEALADTGSKPVAGKEAAQPSSARDLMAEAKRFYSDAQIRAAAIQEGYIGDGSMDDAGTVENALIKLLRKAEDTGAPPVAAKLLPGETQGDLISSTQAEPLQLVGEKGVDYGAIQKADETAKAARAESEKGQTTFEDLGAQLTKEEEARLKDEYEKGILSDLEEHQQRGGDELLDAVKSLGGLRIDEPHFGDLKEAFQKKAGFSKLASGEEGYRYKDIFQKNAPGGDALVQALRAKGFDVENPGHLADMLDTRFKTGKKVYGVEARAQEGGISGLESYGMGAAATKEKLSGVTTTGIAQRVATQRVGGEVVPGIGANPQEMITRGRELLRQGAEPAIILQKVSEGGGINADEMSVLRAQVEEASKASNRAYDAAAANPNDTQLQAASDEAFQNEVNWRQKIKPAQTEWQRTGVAMQGETDIDTGSFVGLRRAFIDEHGKDATPQQQAKLKTLATDSLRSETAVSDAKTKYDQALQNQLELFPPEETASIKPGESEAELLQRRFATRLTADPNAKSFDFTPKDISAIWNYTKRNYIDKGVTSLDDTIHGVALDTGLRPEWIREALTKPKALRTVSNELYAKMSQRRDIVQAAKDYIRSADQPLWKRVIKGIWETPFSLAIYGHGTVGGITHAGANIFRPSAWSSYWPDFINQAKFFVRKDIHEAAMQAQVRDPNFITAKRAGLANDPNLTYTDYGTYAKFFGLQAGKRGFDALKTMRQSMFNSIWDKVPDSIKSDPKAASDMAQNYARMINHSTGVIGKGERGFIGSAARAGSPVMFAAKLEASRWMRVIGDPIKTLDTYANWSRVTEGEKAVAIKRTKNAAEFAGVFLGSLYLNQAILSASGSKDKINFTDPSKSDWLKHKIAGHTVAVDGGLLAPIRLLGRLTYDTMIRPRKELRGDTRTSAAIKDVGQYAIGKAAPSVSIAKEAVTAESFDGRLLPWSRDTSKKPRMTWTEYASSHAPIPISGGVREIYDSLRDRGMSKPDAESVLRGLAAFGSELTGARVMEIHEEKEQPSKVKVRP